MAKKKAVKKAAKKPAKKLAKKASKKPAKKVTKTPAKKQAKQPSKKPAKQSARKAGSSPKPTKLKLSPRANRLILGTRKGTFILQRTAKGWKSSVSHPGVPISFASSDPRTGTIWSFLDHGHWGSKISRSDDGGKTWREATPIKYPQGARFIDGFETMDGKPIDPFGPPTDVPKRPKFKDARVLKLWTMAFGGADKPGRIMVGTIPGGMFVSEDDGQSWELARPLWSHESRGGDLFNGDGNGIMHWGGTPAAMGTGEFAAGIHSITVDPRDSNHYMIAISCAGVLETTDDGRTWQGRNKGLRMEYMPNPEADWGHDPHFMSLSAKNPDHVWQQNHCGIFYSTDGAKQWKMVSKQGNTAHFGFPIAVDEEDGSRAWVVPLKGDDSRMAINGALAVCRTDDGGSTWREQRKGLPQSGAYDTVYRHALDIAGSTLAFGSTNGNLYLSDNGGDNWECLGTSLPPIHSVRFG